MKYMIGLRNHPGTVRLCDVVYVDRRGGDGSTRHFLRLPDLSDARDHRRIIELRMGSERSIAPTAAT